VGGEEAVDAAGWLTQEDATRAHHLPLLLGVTAKVDYLPSVLVAVAVVAEPHLHNNLCHVTQCQCIPTSLKDTQTGMIVSLAVLMLRTDIRPKHALHPVDMPFTRRGLIEPIQGSTLQRGMMRAPKQCTNCSCQPCDSVWQSS